MRMSGGMESQWIQRSTYILNPLLVIRFGGLIEAMLRRSNLTPCGVSNTTNFSPISIPVSR